MLKQTSIYNSHFADDGGCNTGSKNIDTEITNHSQFKLDNCTHRNNLHSRTQPRGTDHTSDHVGKCRGTEAEFRGAVGVGCSPVI